MLNYLKKNGVVSDNLFFLGKSVRILKRNYTLRTDIVGKHLVTKGFDEFKWRRIFGRTYLNIKKEANPHILIVGSSGYGKSTFRINS